MKDVVSNRGQTTVLFARGRLDLLALHNFKLLRHELQAQCHFSSYLDARFSNFKKTVVCRYCVLRPAFPDGNRGLSPVFLNIV